MKLSRCRDIWLYGKAARTQCPAFWYKTSGLKADCFFCQVVSSLCHKTSSLERTEEEGEEEEEEDDLDIFGGYDSFRSYNSSVGSDSSSCLDESSDDEVVDREAGELPTSPVHQPHAGRITEGSGSEPGTALPACSPVRDGKNEG